MFRADDSVLERDCKEIALLSDWVLKGNIELTKRYEVPFAHSLSHSASRTEEIRSRRRKKEILMLTGKFSEVWYQAV